MSEVWGMVRRHPDAEAPDPAVDFALHGARSVAMWLACRH